MRGVLATGSVLLGLFVLIVVFLDPRILWDRTLLVGDGIYYVDPSFRAVGGDAFNTQPKNFLMEIDNTRQAYPFRRHAQTSLWQGEIPWWNPYLALGTPFAALGADVFDPVLTLLDLVAPATKLTNALAVAELWIGATGMFLLLGALGASRSARLLAAVAFAFSGWTIVWLGRSNLTEEMWMPWLFLAAERFVDRPCVRRFGLLALATALIALPAHLQTTFHIGIALAGYVVVRLAGLGLRRAARILVGILLAGALGLGVALVQIAPMVEFVGQSDLPPEGRGKQLPASDARSAAWYGLRGDWKLLGEEGPTIVTAVSPLFFGSPQAYTYWWPPRNFPETTMYVGLLPLFFALYGFARRRGMPAKAAWLGLVVVSLGVIYGLPGFNLVNYLPGFNRINNGRLRLVYRFAIVVAAAFGFDRFVAGADSRRRRLVWVAGYGVAVVALPAAVPAALAALPKRVTGLAGMGTWTMFDLAWEHLATLGILGVFAALALALVLGRVGATAFRVAAVAIAFVDLFWFLGDYNSPIPSRYVFPETPVVRFLKKDPTLFRVSSNPPGVVMTPNTKLPYRIFDVDIYSILTIDRYAALQKAVNPPPPKGFRRAFSFRIFLFEEPARHRGLVNLMNVKYFLVPADASVGAPFRPPAWFRLVYDREVKIYENPEALPRAFLAGRAVIVDSPAEALATVTRSDFDPRAAVLLEEPSSPRLDAAAAADPGTAEVRAISANRIVVHADARRPAYLVLSEAYYPGWRARVDGQDAPLYRADYLFRAVYLGPGSHEVVLTFAPRSLPVAGAVSLAALGIIGGCLVWGAARRRAVSGPARAGTP